MRRVGPVAVLLLAFALTSCGGSKDTKDAKDDAAQPPAGLVLKVLKAGTGDTVAESDTVTMDYQGSVFATGKVFDESYSSAPRPFSPKGVVPGFGAALVGQKVGSQILVSIPPQFGYGAAGNSQAGISGTDTIVFVIDIKSTQHASLNCDIKAGAASSAVTVSGKFGAVSKPTGDSTVKAKKIERTIVKAGKGPVAKVGELVTVRLSIYNSRTGKKLQSNTGQLEAGSPDAGDIYGAGIACIKTGSRVVTTVPVTEIPGAVSKDIKKTDTIILITDLIKIDPAAPSTLPPTTEWIDAPEVTFNGDQPPTVGLPAVAK